MPQVEENQIAVQSRRSRLDWLHRLLSPVPILRGVFASRNLCDLHCDIAPEKGQPIFVLVHGTWAVQALWTLRDSRLRGVLLEQWPKAGIYRFVWSGVNGARQRIIASEVLSEQLDRLLTIYPSSKIVAIAHSHGGNILAWAASRIRDQLCGAVYLNTPFIYVSKQPNLFLAAWLMNLSLCGMMYGFLVLRSLRWGLLTFALPFIVMFVLPFRSIQGTLAQLSNSNRKISREFVFSVAGDEAAAALGGVYFSQWLAYSTFMKIFIPLGLALGAIGIIALFAAPDSSFMNLMNHAIWVVQGIVFGILNLVFLVTMAGYGLILAIIALNRSVAVTATPVGSAECTTIIASSKDRLRHSLVYESPEVIHAILHSLQLVLRRPDPVDVSMKEADGNS